MARRRKGEETLIVTGLIRLASYLGKNGDRRDSEDRGGATVLIDSLRRHFLLIVVQDYRHQNFNQRRENEQSARQNEGIEAVASGKRGSWLSTASR